MSTTDHAKAIASLLKNLRGSYEVPEPADRTPLEEFVYSFFLWDASASKAEAAYKRVVNSMVDFNELRVTRPPELITLLGKNYPKVEERAERLRASLNDLYTREFAVTLDPCVAMSKRDARKYLEGVHGCPQFVWARVLLMRMEGHALPVDDRLNYRLIEAGVIDEESDCAKTAGLLERHIKADDALASHGLMLAWSEDPATEPKRIKPKPKPEIRVEFKPEPKPEPVKPARPAAAKDAPRDTPKAPAKKAAAGTKPKARKPAKP